VVVIFFLAGKAISLTTVYKIEAESFFDIRIIFLGVFLHSCRTFSTS